MRLFNVVTVFVALSLIGVEFSVAAFINPTARRLEPQQQLIFLSRVAGILGKVMPIWYPLVGALLLVQTWIHWSTASRGALIAASGIWILASLASILFLVPLNARIAKGSPDWEHTHKTWDTRHRIRTVALTLASLLLTYALTSSASPR